MTVQHYYNAVHVGGPMLPRLRHVTGITSAHCGSLTKCQSGMPVKLHCPRRCTLPRHQSHLDWRHADAGTHFLAAQLTLSSVARRASYTPHINSITAKASLWATLILKCFQTRDASSLMKAFVTFVRPILEYASIVWNPYYKGDIDKVENVQRRFTKKLACYHNLSYEHRLAQLSIDSTQIRRARRDLIMCYKCY